jgi:hypothetical protein
LEVTDREVHVFDGIGIRLDVVESECLFRGETISGRFRVMQVWVTEDDRWVLAGVQYTGMATDAA